MHRFSSNSIIFLQKIFLRVIRIFFGRRLFHESTFQVFGKIRTLHSAPFEVRVTRIVRIIITHASTLSCYVNNHCHDAYLSNLRLNKLQSSIRTSKQKPVNKKRSPSFLTELPYPWHLDARTRGQENTWRWKYPGRIAWSLNN